MSVFDFGSLFAFPRVRTDAGAMPIFKHIDYNDLERVDSVITTIIAGGEVKIVSHGDIPKGEVHMVQNRKCVGKIINIE